MSQRIVTSLTLVSMLRGLGSTIMMTFLSVYAVSVGVSLAQIGAISTITTGVGVLLLPLFGLATDVIGRKKMMILSTLLRGLSPLVPLFVEGYWGVFCAYLLLNTSMYAWTPARGATVADSVERDSIGVAFATISVPFQIARTLSPYLSGILIKYYGYRPIFLLSSAFIFSAAIIIYLEVEEKKGAKYFSVWEFFNGLRPTKKEIGFQIFLALDRASWRFWMPIFNSYLKAHLGFTEDLIGLVNTFRGLTSSLFIIPAGSIVDKYGWKPVILISEISGVLAVTSLIFAKDIVTVSIGTSLIGISIAFWNPSFNVAVSYIAPNSSELGRTFARASFYRSIASVPTPTIGGALFEVLPTLPMVLGALGLSINTLFLWRLYFRNKNKG